MFGNFVISLTSCTMCCRQSAVQHPQLFKSVRSSLDTARRANEPRIIKSHLPVALLPIQLWRKKPKIICAVRNPAEMSKSYYEQYYYLHGYQGSYEEFCKLLMADRVLYAPYLSHLTEMWRMRDDENLFIQKFDEMETDFEDFVRRLVEFLGKTVSDEQIVELQTYFSTLVSSQIDIPSTNKLWKRKPVDAPPSVTSTIDFIVDKWAQKTFDDFGLQLN